MAGSPEAVVTYNGLDGACAAAAVLVRRPDARLIVTSARRAGSSLERLSHEDTLCRLHICGVGVRGDGEKVSRCLEKLRAGGTEVVWYCGRGYLDKSRDWFARFCRPVFENTRTNTALLCRRMGLNNHERARELTRLAALDPNLGEKDERPRASEAQRFWIDLVEAAVSQYFKYQNENPYKRAIRCLSTGKAGDDERRLLKIFRRHGGEHALRGKSEEMKRLRARIKAVADADEHVLITGESGVGKEYAARLIHEAGSRTMEPIFTVNCAVFAGNEGLADSMLFGHVKGAFTGALEKREGAFCAADGGVLFLDELGELPLKVQGKFLRVIEDGWVAPVGRDAPERQVDVRVIGATNRHLPGMVRDGMFRDDLFHRLDVLRVHVPALREHREDIGDIAEHLLRSMQWPGQTPRLSQDETNTLASYHWPGNVRQLRKILKRARLMGEPVRSVLSEEILYLDSGAHQRRIGPESAASIADLKSIQRQYALGAYELNGRNLTDTARKLGISPNTLRKYLT